MLLILISQNEIKRFQNDFTKKKMQNESQNSVRHFDTDIEVLTRLIILVRGRILLEKIQKHLGLCLKRRESSVDLECWGQCTLNV